MRRFSAPSSDAPSTPVAPPAAAPISPPFRLVVFASSAFSLPALRALHAARATLLRDSSLTLVTPADKPTGRGRVVVASEIKTLAQSLGFRVEQLPFDIDFRMSGWDLPPSLKGQVDVGVVVSFGYMLQGSLIAQFPGGVINIHPSLLPRYRGASPIQFALAQGDTHTGVSIIDVHPTLIDGGRVLSQERVAIPEGANFASLSDSLATQGAQRLIEVLHDLHATRQKGVAQSALAAAAAAAPTSAAAASAPAPADPRATAPRIPKSAGELRWALHGPETLYRIWSALHTFMPVFTAFGGQRIQLHRVRLDATSLSAAALSSSPLPATSHFPTFAEAQAVGVGGLFFDSESQCVGVVCASSTLAEPRVLLVAQLQLAYKPNPVDASTFARGYLDKRKLKPGQTMSAWKFESSEGADWFGSRLTTPERPLLRT